MGTLGTSPFITAGSEKPGGRGLDRAENKAGILLTCTILYELTATSWVFQLGKTGRYSPLRGLTSSFCGCLNHPVIDTGFSCLSSYTSGHDGVFIFTESALCSGPIQS